MGGLTCIGRGSCQCCVMRLAAPTDPKVSTTPSFNRFAITLDGICVAQPTEPDMRKPRVTFTFPPLPLEKVLIMGIVEGRVVQKSGCGAARALKREKAQEVGAEAVSKEALFSEADIVSLHTLLSRRTRGLVDADALRLMKREARLVNTSRGAIVDEAAVLDALRHERIGGYAVDVFDVEPLPVDHPFRSLPNVLATLHLGYVGDGLYRTFYSDSARNSLDWLSSLAAVRT